MPHSNRAVRWSIATLFTVATSAASYAALQFLQTPLDKSRTPEEIRAYQISMRRDEIAQTQINQQLANTKKHLDGQISGDDQKIGKLVTVVPFSIDWDKATQEAEQGQDRVEKFSTVLDYGIPVTMGLVVAGYYLLRKPQSETNAANAAPTSPAA